MTNHAGGIQPQQKDVAIEIMNLSKSFGIQQVLKNVSMHLNKEENLVVLGKSGTGKSVLIKCIVGLLPYDSGCIKVLGTDLDQLAKDKMQEIRKQTGFLFQSAALYDSMTVKENLEFPLVRIRKDLDKKQVNEKVEEVLENVGLKDALNKMPSQLSGGMRKRIGLARTIIVDPKIILYDEPTTGLDPITSDEISNLINKIQKKYKTSSIIITHDLPCARKTGNRVVLLKDGLVYAQGSIKEMENSDDEYVQQFFKNN